MSYEVFQNMGSQWSFSVSSEPVRGSRSQPKTEKIGDAKEQSELVKINEQIKAVNAKI